jgi:antagonist of KipI
LAVVETLEVLSPGALTTVQDRGRFGYGRYGVAPSGAVDSFSLRIGNLLMDNPEDEACLEITVMGLRVRVLTDLLIAITGADLHPHLNEKPLKMWHAHLLKKGEILSFRGPRSGCRAYLAVGGGISLSPVMGSKSTNLFSRFGGLEGRALKKGDILSSDSPHLHLKAKGRAVEQRWIPSYRKKWALRVLLGPQDDHFTEEGKRALLHAPFEVTPQSDRTGVRLAGPALQRKPGMEDSIISEGVIAGTIQVPGDGQPIIILAETVTGGYRKIATVITADLPVLGQIRPGDTVRFEEVSLDEAYQALREAEAAIEKLKAGLFRDC